MRGAVAIPSLAAALTLGACIGVREGEMELRKITVQQTSETGFAVSIEALNVDGYALARCVAAAYTDAHRDKEGARLFNIYLRDGGRLTDEFRVADGVRTQTTTGQQTYQFASEGEHDGRDVMSVDLQLALCERQGLPTKLGEG